MEKALAMGVMKYIYKPVGVKTLLDAVNVLLSGENVPGGAQSREEG